MAQLHLFVKGQTLTIQSETGRVVENSENYLKADVTLLDEYWEGLNLSLLVEYDGSTFSCGAGSEDRTYIVNSSYIQPPGFFLTLVGQKTLETEEGVQEVQVPTNSIFIPVHLSNSLEADEELTNPPERWESAVDDFNITIDEFKATVNETIDEFEAKVEDKIEVLGERVTTNEGNISNLQTDVETTKGNLSTFIGQTENNISELDGRIDTIEGQELNERVITNEDKIEVLGTELIDIRVGADGVAYSSAGESVRAVTGNLLSNIETLQTFKQNATNELEQRANALNNTVTGTSVIKLSNVSPVEHPLQISLSSDTVTDYSSVLLSVYGRNLYQLTRAAYNGGTIEMFTFEDGILTLRGTPTESLSINLNLPELPNGTYTVSNTLENAYICYFYTGDTRAYTDSTFVVSEEKQLSHFQVRVQSGMSVDGICNIQIEVGDTVSDYVDYIEPTYNNAASLIEISPPSSVYPDTVIFCDNPEVNIEVEYNQDIHILEDGMAHGVYNINTLPLIGGKLNYTAVGQLPTQPRYWIKGSSRSVLIPYSKNDENENLYLFSEENTGEIAFFENYHSPNNTGNAPCLNFTVGTDTIERNLYEFGTSDSVQEIHIPDGTKYIYVLYSMKGTGSRLPSKLEINGYDYCKGVTENIISLGRKFSLIENDYISALELLGGAE